MEPFYFGPFLVRLILCHGILMMVRVEAERFIHQNFSMMTMEKEEKERLLDLCQKMHFVGSFLIAFCIR